MRRETGTTTDPVSDAPEPAAALDPALEKERALRDPGADVPESKPSLARRVRILLEDGIDHEPNTSYCHSHD